LRKANNPNYNLLETKLSKFLQMMSALLHKAGIKCRFFYAKKKATLNRAAFNAQIKLN
jgi:hypothetical protein